MKDNKETLRIARIIDAIERIEKYTSGVLFDNFSQGNQLFDAVLMQFVVIGEMIVAMNDAFKNLHPDLPWHEAVGIRNEIAHGYFNIKPEIIWRTIQNDLPKLKKELAKILE